MGRLLNKPFVVTLLMMAAVSVALSTVFVASDNGSTPTAAFWVHYGDNGTLEYYEDSQGNHILDFSYAGYMGGGVPIPDVPVQVTLSPGTGDNTARIQAAIDRVSQLPPDENGFRGAVLLRRGTYDIGGTLTINTSGVVLRGGGDGPDGTLLRATGTARQLVSIRGAGPRRQVGETHTITDDYVPLGATTFHVDSTDGLAVGDPVVVQRPVTQVWIDAIAMTPYWRPNGGLSFECTITDISDDQITIDIPLCNPIEQQYTTGLVWKYDDSDRIEQVGIENLRSNAHEFATQPGYSHHNSSAVGFDNAWNGWLRQVTIEQYGNGFIIGGQAKWVTIEDCAYVNPAVLTGPSARGGPASYTISGQQNLVHRCRASGRSNFHALVSQAATAGPNVFLNIYGEGTAYDAGPHQRWAAGVLFDNVTLTKSRRCALR